MLELKEPESYRYSLHHLGFRPFFLLAGLFSVISIAVWIWLYREPSGFVQLQRLSTVSWHAHEMIFGYGMAVIAGFLLTAVRNWTGVQTIHGAPLLMLAFTWLLARVMPFLPYTDALLAMAVLDLVFNLALCAAIFYPIAKVKQWGQMGVWSKVFILTIGNGLFYLGVFGHLEQGIQWGLYTGLYIIVSLIMLMGRRVIPFFIEKGVGYPVTVKNYRWVDLGSLVLMLVFWLVEVFSPWKQLAGWLALSLFVLHSIRLVSWHTAGIWKKPLLWVLYLAYAWLVLGFAMRGLDLFIEINAMLSIHAFAYGGVALMTIGMMARVSLGHTGRNVFDPPRGLGLMFLLLLAGAIVRVFFPLLMPGNYSDWVLYSQVLWIAAFLIFSWMYVPMLVRARVDGKFG